jgi:hypothetical protein
LLDQGPSVRDVTSNLVGAIPFVGPDLRKAMEGSTTAVPVGMNMASNMPEEGFKYGEPAKHKKAGIETYKMPTTDLLDAMKVSDLVGTSGLSRAAESAGYGEVPDLMDVLDAAQVGAGLYSAAKLGAKGAKAAGKGAVKVLEQAGTGPRSGSMAAQRGALKLGGGNWVDTETKQAINKLKPEESYPQTYIDSAKEDLAEYLKNPDLHPEAATEIERLPRDIAHMEQTSAFNKWIDSKVGNYVRNQMSTPDDPVVKMLDARAAKIESDYATGQKRIAKLDERIAQAEATASTAEERNTLANMKRTRAQRSAEVESDRELAMNALLPEGKDYAGYEYLNNDIGRVKEKREKAGFPAEGYAQSNPAKAWEAAQDMGLVIKPAEQFQNQEEKLAALRAAEKELNQYQNVELPDKFKQHLDSTQLDEGTKQKLIQNAPKDLMGHMIGEEEKRDQLNEAYRQARDKANAASLAMAEDNPHLTKLAPDTPVYRAIYLPDLGIDHIIDVLKDDIASGKLKLEDLNKITMDQAVKRAGEYDFEMAKKARDAAATARESMPVYKEYPEGYKWVQLTKPGEFNAESDAMGHSVRGYEPERGHPDWTPESGDSGRENYGHGGWEAIKSGKAKVYSLVDPSGKPHVTVEVKNPQEISDELRYKHKDKINDRMSDYFIDNPDATHQEALERVLAGMKNDFPPSITQIKGKGNARPQAKYDPYTQDFVKSGNWADVNELRNTGLRDIERTPKIKEYLKKKGADVPRYLTEDEYQGHESDFLMDQLYPKDEPPVGGMKAGGEVHMSIGGDLLKAAKTAKAVAEAKSALPAPAVIPNLLKKSTASEIGREERARRQAVGAAEQARQELATQTPVPVGYVTHTEKSPNPHVGYRYEADQPVGIVPSPTIDVGALERSHKGASMLPLPWDSTNRNVRVSSVSGEDLAHPIWSHGGIPYSSDEQHLLENIGGASGRSIANRIVGREENARKENKLLGGTGEIIHAVNTMGKGGENYALPSSEFAFDVINRRVNNGDLTLKEADDLSNEIRNYVDPDTKKQPFKNWAGFISRDGAAQMYTGEGLNGPAGDLRKLIAKNIIYKKKNQELLNFNAEDFVNSITHDPLKDVGRGYIGSNLLSNVETSPMKLSKTADFPWLNPYDTNFSATHLGQLEDLVPIQAVMSRRINPIEQEFLAKQAAKVNGKPYTPESLQGSAISALEKRKDNVAQFMDDQFFQDLSDYMEALKTPLEKKKGGLARAKKPKKVARHGNTVSN